MNNLRRSKLSLRGIKTTLLGIITSFILAVIKIFSGIIGNSYALVADGIESVADICAATIMAREWVSTRPRASIFSGMAEKLAAFCTWGSTSAIST